mgnify:CR=1 FL=1
MSWEAALRWRLLNAPAVLALTGTHPDDGLPSIEWGNLRQGAERPAIVLKLVSDTRPVTHDGFDSIRSSRVRASIQAETRADVIALREAAIAALAPAGRFGATGAQVWFDRTGFELLRDIGAPTETGFVHADSVDLIVTHKG